MAEVVIKTSGPPTTRTVVVVLCWALVFFDGYDIVSFGAVVPALLSYPGWDVTPADVGTIGALTLLAMAIGAVAAGSLTRRLGRSRVLALCLCWFSVTVAAAAMAPTELLFASGRVLAGFGLGCLLPVASALVLDNAAPARRTLVYGVMFSAYPCGGMVAGIAAGRLGLDGDFRTPLALGALALLAVPAVLRLRDVASVPPDQKDPPRRSGGSAADLFAERGVYRTVLLWMATFMCLLVIYGLYTWLPSIMQATGYGLASAVAFLVILNLGGVVGMLVSGWAADRLGVRVVGGMACLLGGLAIGLLSLRPPTALGYVLIAVAGMSAIGAQVVINACVADFYSARHRATALGWALGVGRLGAIAGPPLGAVVITAGLPAEWHFYSFGTASVLAALCLFLVARGPNREETARPETARPETARPETARP